MDFVSDALAGGRRIKEMTIVDDFTKESVDIALNLADQDSILLARFIAALLLRYV